MESSNVFKKLLVINRSSHGLSKVVTQCHQGCQSHFLSSLRSSGVVMISHMGHHRRFMRPSLRVISHHCHHGDVLFITCSQASYELLPMPIYLWEVVNVIMWVISDVIRDSHKVLMRFNRIIGSLHQKSSGSSPLVFKVIKSHH